jgi:hypothetical protein
MATKGSFMDSKNACGFFLSNPTFGPVAVGVLSVSYRPPTGEHEPDRGCAATPDSLFAKDNERQEG